MEQLQSLWEVFAEDVLSLLPLSPFRQYLDYFAGWEYLGYLNWFFPFKHCLIVLAAWTAVISTYFTWSVVLRWLKIIGD